ncbi:DUF3040 domain-containing protein [Paractinoplanes durhamensis]|uniref:DUF3040 domain-containing protein n=1 Tax=Paractinoplanes durhamensis TaxID=113563 RepID=A0ABQ3Z1X0_9ACTN|nr:DUF3040 domain-containing protein [Actinoplanes durhamensis]GIE03804.1 hypothetical protein Adu01nite_51540 [Actinoplanes durhamensis]
MLSREDSRRLAELERQLRRDDPEFCARMTGGGDSPAPRRRHTLSLICTATVIWLAAITLGVLDWWPAAILAAICGTTVIAVLIYHRARRRRGRS